MVTVQYRTLSLVGGWTVQEIQNIKFKGHTVWNGCKKSFFKKKKKKKEEL